MHTGTIPSKTLRETVLNLSGWRERGVYGRAHRNKENITAEDLRRRLHITLDHEVEESPSLAGQAPVRGPYGVHVDLATAPAREHPDEPAKPDVLHDEKGGHKANANALQHGLVDNAAGICADWAGDRKVNRAIAVAQPPCVRVRRCREGDAWQVEEIFRRIQCAVTLDEVRRGGKDAIKGPDLSSVVCGILW